MQTQQDLLILFCITLFLVAFTYAIHPTLSPTARAIISTNASMGVKSSGGPYGVR